MGDREAPILVAVDFSPDSMAAFEWAVNTALRFDCPLVVVHIVHDPAASPGTYVNWGFGGVEPDNCANKSFVFATNQNYAAMAEALRRRYERIKKGEVPMPDVLFVVGGKGQLAEAMKVLDDLQLDWLTVVAVAKGRARRPGAERLFRPESDRPMELPADSPALLLIQQIRDEAHRFAITGHRQRRAKARKKSPLERIPGLGPKKRRELLRQFGGLQGVTSAGIDDLVKVRGIGRTMAETIYNELHLEP